MEYEIFVKFYGNAYYVVKANSEEEACEKVWEKFNREKRETRFDLFDSSMEIEGVREPVLPDEYYL